MMPVLAGSARVRIAIRGPAASHRRADRPWRGGHVVRGV